MPPYATLTVLGEKHKKTATPTRAELIQEYKKKVNNDAAKKMAAQIAGYAGKG